MKNAISYIAVREKFNYDKETGILSWRNDSGMGARYPAGSEVGSVDLSGPKLTKSYRRVNLGGTHFYVHRVIWVWVAGVQPENEIDHIDGNGLNNKWENLRSVSRLQNAKNRRINTNNTSGTAGITYRKDSDRWRARIAVDGKVIFLGSYDDKQDAINARKEAERKYYEVDQTERYSD